MGARPNGSYTGIASYIDAPWDPLSERTQYVQRAFHRAHATEWCDSTTLANLDTLRTRSQDVGLPIEERLAACTACVELTVRHLRVGTSSAWDTAQEPVCRYLITAPVFVYHQAAGTTDPLTTATRYCCP